MDGLNDDPTLDDLRSNGIDVPLDSELVEDFRYRPDQFEGCKWGIEKALPALLIKTRGGLFRAFSLFPIASSQPGRFEIYEGQGETPEQAKQACLATSINARNRIAESLFEYIALREATEEAFADMQREKS